MLHALARRIALAGLTVGTAIAAAPVHAWGFEGHRLVAGLAEPLLNARARAQVQRLLVLEPGATLSSIATWADEIRSPVSGPWHYINFPQGDCHYEQLRDCAKGACVVEALQAQVDLLKSDVDDAQRLVALKYVVHLVGDVHQPLHAGHREDKGGNLFQIQLRGQGRNLHSLWDTGLLMSHAGGVTALREEIRAWLPVEPVAPQAPAVAQWAEESCKLVEAEGFYPATHKIEEGYLDSQEATLKARLSQAVLRLAAVLNDALK